MREFKGILLTHEIVDKDERSREQKRLKSYLKGGKFFTHKGKKYHTTPQPISSNPEEGLLPEITI